MSSLRVTAGRPGGPVSADVRQDFRANKVGVELCSQAMRGFSSDIRYALRTLRYGGISTVVAVLSLAIGVGANAAGSFHGSFSIEGRPDTPVERPLAPIRIVSPGYFRVMKIPILSGRDYDQHDEVGEVGSLPSVIVSRTLAERFWPGQDAIGKRVQ